MSKQCLRSDILKALPFIHPLFCCAKLPFTAACNFFRPLKGQSLMSLCKLADMKQTNKQKCSFIICQNINAISSVIAFFFDGEKYIHSHNSVTNNIYCCMCCAALKSAAVYKRCPSPDCLLSCHTGHLQ